MCDDDGEEAKQEQCSACIYHRVEHPHRDKCRDRKVRHLLEDKKERNKNKIIIIIIKNIYIHTHICVCVHMCSDMYMYTQNALPAAQHSCWVWSSALWKCCCHCGSTHSLLGSNFLGPSMPSDSTGLPQHQCQEISGAAKPRLALSCSTCCTHLSEERRWTKWFKLLLNCAIHYLWNCKLIRKRLTI